MTLEEIAYRIFRRIHNRDANMEIRDRGGK